MKDIQVIEPDARKKTNLECPICDMTYSQKDYKILKEHKRLTYFSVQPDNGKRISPVCHLCLRDVVLKLNDNQPTEVLITSKQRTINHTFYGNTEEEA